MLQIKNTLGGGKPEGLYAWTKNILSFGEKSTASGQEVSHSSTATGTSVNVYYSTEYTFDSLTGIYTLVNPSVISVSYGSQATIDATNYAMFEASSGSVMYKATGSTLYLRNNSSGLSLMAQSSSYNVSVYGSETAKTFIDYVVSDKETAYPDGGEKGGYWYERVVEGAKVAYGQITLSDVTSATIEHGLGKTPTKFILISKGISANNRIVGTYLIDNTASKALYFNANGVYACRTTGNTTMDDANINLGAEQTTGMMACAYYGDYNWIAVAE